MVLFEKKCVGLNTCNVDTPKGTISFAHKLSPSNAANSPQRRWIKPSKIILAPVGPPRQLVERRLRQQLVRRLCPPLVQLLAPSGQASRPITALAMDERSHNFPSRAYWGCYCVH